MTVLWTLAVIIIHLAINCALHRGVPKATNINACQDAFVTKFRGCSCEPVSTVEGNPSMQINCKYLKIDVLTDLSALFYGNESARHFVDLSAVRLTDSALRVVGQDAFHRANVETIDLSSNVIDTINANAFRGLESHLRQLNLQGNQLVTVPAWSFTYLHQLEYLDLRRNRIPELSRSSFAETQLAHLHYLHLDENHIENLAAGALSQLPLRVLTLADNRLTDIGDRSLPDSLWHLDLAHNRLIKLPYAAIRQLNRLRVLDLTGNHISTVLGHHGLSSEGSEPLDLRLSSNRIRSLESGAFDSFVVLHRLDLSHNQIDRIHVAAFRAISGLNQLDLGHNAIDSLLAGCLTPLANSLEELSLMENRLSSSPSALRPLRSLKKLSLSHNQLESLNAEHFANMKGNLSELSLSTNRFTVTPSDVLQGMYRLHTLDLSRNQITRIDKTAFGTLSAKKKSSVMAEGTGLGSALSLVNLNLAGNRIEEIVHPETFLYLSSLTHLDLSYNRLRRLSRVALERLESLESFYLHHNEMIEFPRNALFSLNKLRNLLLDHNQILNLPNYTFQRLVRLERLGLSHNRIHTLNAKTFHSTNAMQVRWLNLGFNKIATMHTSAFENLANLEQLLLNDNRLTNLQPQIISSLPNLRYLTLSGNQINETFEGAFVNLPLLENLSMAHNRLRTMKEGIFHGVPNLRRIDLNHNRIESFDLDFLGNETRRLTLLDLSNNVLRKLDISSVKKSLMKLQLDSNQLEFIDDKMLSGFDRLESVDLSRNDLIDIQPTAFARSANLRRIVLANNNLRGIWRGTFKDQKFIELLDLSGNALQSLDDGVFGAGNVLELRLARNHFAGVPIRGLASVRRSLSALDLSFNHIKSLEWRDFAGLVNISWLDLSHNRIETLEEEVFREMVHLQHLDLSANPIATWSPNAFLKLSDNIAWLSLANTGLFSLPQLHSVSRLRELNVSGNRIYELQARQIDGLTRLTSLDLADNNLLELKASVCQNLAQLRQLNLSGNDIRVLQPEYFALFGLETLHIGKMSNLVQIPEPAAFSSLQHLRHLYMYDMPLLASFPIKEILTYLPPLRSLRLEFKGSLLTKDIFEGADTRFLRHLTISGSKLRKLDDLVFSSLRGYQIFLTIRDTSLAEFPAAVLRNMSGISMLNLALINNSISTLRPFDDAIQSPQQMLNAQGMLLESVDLRNNPIICDCRLAWLTKWLDYHLAEDTNTEWASIQNRLASTKCKVSTISTRRSESKQTKSVFSLLDVYRRHVAIDGTYSANGEVIHHYKYSISDCDVNRNQSSYEQRPTTKHIVILAALILVLF